VSELATIMWTAAFTILGGVLVYVVGEVLSKFFIEPIHDLKRVIGEVRFNLAYFSPILHTPTSRTRERSDEASKELLKNSCDLFSKVNAIPFYELVSRISCGFLPSKRCAKEAAVQLRELTTYLHEDGSKAAESIEVIGRRVKKVEECLGLESIE